MLTAFSGGYTHYTFQQNKQEGNRAQFYNLTFMYSKLFTSPTHHYVRIHNDLIQHKHNTHSQYENIGFRDEVVSYLISTLGIWMEIGQ